MKNNKSNPMVTLEITMLGEDYRVFTKSVSAAEAETVIRFFHEPDSYRVSGEYAPRVLIRNLTEEARAAEEKKMAQEVLAAKAAKKAAREAEKARRVEETRRHQEEVRTNGAFAVAYREALARKGLA